MGSVHGCGERPVTIGAQRAVLLDTDVWSGLYSGSLRHHDVRAGKWEALIKGRSVAIAIQTRAEVLFGLALRNVGQARRDSVIGQLDATTTVPINEDIVVAYAELAAACTRMGRGLHQKQHTGDRWIAATAIALGIPLLAGDGIYKGAPGLQLLSDP